MALRSTLLAATLAASLAARRQVNWYVNAGDVSGNVAFFTEHGASITGAYLCCNLARISASGVASFNVTALTEYTSALRAAGAVSVLAVMSIAEASVHSGSWATGGATAALSSAARSSGLDGWISDYEPADNYTIAHARAYGAFLADAAVSLHAEGKLMGMDIAGWGILDFWSVYDALGLDVATSMTPTYDGKNVTADEAFVASTLKYIPGTVLAIGIGSELYNGSQPEWQYNWTASRLHTFVSYLATAHVRSVDIWPADIDHYSNATAPWFFDTLAAYLNGTI